MQKALVDFLQRTLQMQKNKSTSVERESEEKDVFKSKTHTTKGFINRTVNGRGIFVV